ncbi:MipA/OmpV family protein [Paucibacter sp. DJ1R-11]|uniref:MipA/OmpV family protein n=1 Tax=Paucibacter sp. DJ1R-11 TaxID=2893556 RepID=UPI0021E4C6D6|nr:MipA/OmpV family protein [Paucibacter sp. DJ1R-11]MCV2362509.1 MipA/OmpV family protein [Paucibacter sp. DJ1R-11]
MKFARTHLLKPKTAWVFAMLAAAGFGAQAAEPSPSEGLHGLIGFGAVYSPTYVGAKESRSHAVLLPDLRYRKGAFEASTMGGLRYWAVERPDFQFALTLSGDAGREDHKVKGFLGQSGSDRLRGMGKLKGSAEVGVAGSWSGLGLPLNFELKTALGKQGHGGTLASLGSSLPLLASGPLELGAEASLGFGDKRYLQSYYGVTAAQAAATSFKEFHPKAGLYGADLGLTGRYKLSDSLSLMAHAGYHRVLGDAAKSPLVERKGAPTLLLGLGYTF